MTRPIDRSPDGQPALDAIARRRTATRFDPDRPLPTPTLARLLKLATLAPSPANLQPWRFVVVRDPLNRRKLRRCTFGESRLAEAPVALIVLGYLNPHRTDLDAAIALQLALGAIDPDRAARIRAEVPRSWARSAESTARATRAAMLAAATLMIAAESIGVGSAWLDEFDAEAVRIAFGVPDDHAICGLLALGFALDDPPFPGRFGLDHVCFEEHFGRPWTLDEPDPLFPIPERPSEHRP